MAGERGRDASGTASGTDVEPLAGGMDEEERKRGGAPRGDAPPAPYHAPAVPEGGLAPRGGADPEGGSTPREGTPPDPGAAPRRDLDAKVDQERREYEDEASNAPRRRE